MGNYLPPFGKQIKEWVRRDCLVPYNPDSGHGEYLGPIMIHKVFKSLFLPLSAIKGSFRVLSNPKNPESVSSKSYQSKLLIYL